MSRKFSMVLPLVAIFAAALAFAQQPDPEKKVVIASDASGELFWLPFTLKEAVDKTGRREGISFAVGFNYAEARSVPPAAVLPESMQRAGANSNVQYRSSLMVLFKQCGARGIEVTNAGYYHGLDLTGGVAALELVKEPVFDQNDLLDAASKLACELHESRRKQR